MEAYVKIAGTWVYLYRAVDQYGQVIDVSVSTRRDTVAAREFFTRALRLAAPPVDVSRDRTPVYPRVLDELAPAARHVTEQYANNRIEADHGRLKAWLRPMTENAEHCTHDLSWARVHRHAVHVDLLRGGVTDLPYPNLDPHAGPVLRPYPRDPRG
jgi:transposase-like protein